MMSREQLLEQARSSSYKPEILEKVYHLFDTLSQIAALPYLKERLVLKGGTALNLFHFSAVPRLSVDIDLNYIGNLDRTIMLQERAKINDTITQILIKNKFEPYRNPGHHAGGKVVWRYNSVLGQKGNLEIDLNFMYRQPLLPVCFMKPAMVGLSNFEFPVLDIHELAAGKLSALLTRTASRDLFDSHYLLTEIRMDEKTLRLAFIVYISMTRIDPQKLTVDQIRYDIKDLNNRLLPVLRQKNLPRGKPKLEAWAQSMLEELKSALSLVLPLKDNERAFINSIQKFGKIDPSLITSKQRLQAAIQNHPAILWASQREKA